MAADSCWMSARSSATVFEGVSVVVVGDDEQDGPCMRECPLSALCVAVMSSVSAVDVERTFEIVIHHD